MAKQRENKVLKGLKEVFRNPKYLGIAISIAGIFFLLNILLPNIKTLATMLTTANISVSFKFISALAQGGFENMTNLARTSLISISILLGVVGSLITYKVKMNQAFFGNSGKTTTIAAVLGLVAPGCASCGIGALSALGLTSSLAFLPFKGAEIGLVSVVLLMISTVSLSTKIADGNSCKIPVRKK